MTGAIDSPGNLRDAEVLDTKKLASYLSQQGLDVGTDITVSQFLSGYSNLTFMLETDAGEFVLRRPPLGSKVKSGHDMSREWRVLSALADHFDRSPRPTLYCEDDAVIGAPFYVMERVVGVILRGAEHDVEGLDDGAMRNACEALVDTLADIHAVDLKRCGLDDFGKPDGYVRRAG